jgi:hypothetical protein
MIRTTILKTMTMRSRSPVELTQWIEQSARLSRGPGLFRLRQGHVRAWCAGRSRNLSSLRSHETLEREPPMVRGVILRPGSTGSFWNKGRHHLLGLLPAHSDDAGPERPHPRRAISSSSHTLQRRRASGRAICCPCTKVISWRWQSEANPRTGASFLKQCHSPLVLRQYSLSANRSGVSSIGTRVCTNPHETLESSRSRTTSR